MHNKRIFRSIILLVVVISAISACEKTTESSGNSIIGKWMFYMGVDIENGEETHIDIYDPIYDDYCHALIVEYSENEFTMYMNDIFEVYETVHFDCDIDGNTIIYTHDGEEISEVTFRFEDDMLVIEWEENTETSSPGGKNYYTKYNGNFPPESWTTDLENDSYEPNDDYLTATSIAAGDNAQNHINTSMDEDWFEFSAQEGNTYIIVINGYMSNVVSLFNMDGTTLITENETEIYPFLGYSVESTILWECVDSGSYFFSVRGLDNYDDMGYYQIAVTAVQ
jgi:hypothetical protein